THTHTHTHTHSHRKGKHTFTHIHTCTHTQKHTDTHTHTHTHTQTQHTHTYTHTTHITHIQTNRGIYTVSTIIASQSHYRIRAISEMCGAVFSSLVLFSKADRERKGKKRKEKGEK